MAARGLLRAMADMLSGPGYRGGNGTIAELPVSLLDSSATTARRPARPSQEFVVLNSKAFDDIAARIGKAIEDSPAKDIERNVKAMLASGVAKLDLVPRAEFDVQAQVLLKTRAKLDALEKRIAELETKIGTPPA